MAAKELSLSPIQWVAYFNDHPDVFNEMIDVRVLLGEAGDDEEAQKAALEQGGAILEPLVDDIEKFQNEFLKRTTGKMLTQAEAVQELIYVIRSRGTSEARGGGVSTMKDLTAAIREKYATKPDTEGMTPEEAAKAISDWEAEQAAEISANNHKTADEGADEEAANTLAAEMDEKVTPASVQEVIQIANRVLKEVVQNPTAEDKPKPKTAKSGKSKAEKAKADEEKAFN